ncbi:hypothetical protein J6590_083172 [Homalodisca vitripennis]|nr:hypothetical protein J6590_083172 [Homalodisca vitripennis]
MSLHCNADTAEYLETAECRVDPRFEFPESEDSTHTCLYKLHLAMQNIYNKYKMYNSETGMDLLPLEALNIIAENRTLYVLAASSTVNPHCNADTAEYLETAECRVDPRFESPESEDSTQTCLYKKAGNKKITIKESLIHLAMQNIYNKNKMYNSETGMDLLPLEALNIIAENWTLYVLAASSTVNVGWSDTAEYLETAECRVDPRFESLELEDSTQTLLYMKETGMDLLPLEVLNKIAENQTLYVLAASSTVSVGLRGSFNQNWMWWPHCNADTPEYLETAECRVDPKFEFPESEDSTHTC